MPRFTLEDIQRVQNEMNNQSNANNNQRFTMEQIERVQSQMKGVSSNAAPSSNNKSFRLDNQQVYMGNSKNKSVPKPKGHTEDGVMNLSDTAMQNIADYNKTANKERLQNNADVYFGDKTNPRELANVEKRFVSNMTKQGYTKDEVNSFLKEYKGEKREQIKSGTPVDFNTVDNLMAKDKLNKDDKANAQKLFKNYLKQNDYARNLYNATGGASSYLYGQLTDEQKSEYEKMVALSNKASGMSAFTAGTVDAVPFAKSGINKAENKLDELTGHNTQYGYKANSELTQEQNPLAYLGGSFVSKGAQYGVANDLMKGIPVLQKAKGAMSTAMGGGKFADTFTDVAFDMIPDVLLDTLPTEIENYQNGMRGNDLVQDTAKNLSTNFLFNAGAGLLGALPDAAKGIKNAVGNNEAQKIKNFDNWLQSQNDYLQTVNKAQGAIEGAKQEMRNSFALENARKQDAQEMNELANNWLSLSKEADDVGSNADAPLRYRQAAIAKMRGENPFTYERMSDDELWNIAQSGIKQADEAQNASILENIANNTDDVKAVANDVDNYLDEPISGDNAELIANWRKQNPVLSPEMTDADVENTIASWNYRDNATRTDIEGVTNNIPENILKERGLLNDTPQTDVQAPTPKVQRPVAEVQADFDSLKSKNKMSGVSKSYEVKDNIKSLRFNNDADKEAFNTALKEFHEATEQIDNVKSKADLDALRKNINEKYIALRDSLANAGTYNKQEKEMAKAGLKDFYNAMDNIKVLITPDMRSELDGRTIRELNNAIGRNVFTTDPSKATGIDRGTWNLISSYIGVGESSGNNVDDINALLKTAERAKALANGSFVEPSGFKVNDIIDGDFQTELRETVGELDKFFTENGDDFAKATNEVVNSAPDNISDEIKAIADRYNVPSLNKVDNVADEVKGNVPNLENPNKLMLDDTGIGNKTPAPIKEAKLTYDPEYDVTLEDGEKLSKFRQNSLPRNASTTEEMLANQMKAQEYVYKMQPHEVTDELAKGNLSTEEGIGYFLNKFVNENYKPNAAVENATIKNLYNDVLEQYNETGDESLLDLASRLSKAARVRLTDWGEGVDSAKLWADTPAGIINTVEKDVKANVDARFGRGFSDRVDDIVGDATDIINDTTKDIKTKQKELDKLFKDKGHKTNKKIKGQMELTELLKTGKATDVIEVGDILAEVNKIPHLDEKAQASILKYATKMQGLNPDSAEAKQLIENINRELSKTKHFSIKDKFIELQHILMLTGLPTMIRNTLANVGMLPNQKLAAKLSAIGQNGYKLLVDNDFQKTQAVFVASKYKKLAKEALENMGGTDAIEKGISGKYTNAVKGKIGADEMFLLNTDGVASKIKNAIGMDSNKNTLSQIPVLNKVFSGAKKGLDATAKRLGAEGSFDSLSAYKSNTENFRQLIYGLLEMGDKPFVKKNFTDRLSSYLAAQKITNLEDIPEEALEIAKAEALKATFKDDNDVVELFKALKRIPVIGELELPYVKTPANVTARSIDFSPLALANIIKRYAGGKGTVSDMMDDIGKMVGGSGIALVGAYLAANGVLQGELSDDPRVAAYQKANGVKPYSISTKGLADFVNNKLGTDFDWGDRYETVDWAQPSIASVMAGMSIYDSLNDGDVDAVEGTKRAVSAYTNTILQNSTLQNVLDLADTTYGQDIADNVYEDVIQMPLRTIPSALNTQAKAMDNTQRATYVKGKPLQTAFNVAQSRIPELSKKLPASHDAWGREITNAPEGKASYLNTYLNPGKLGNDNKTPFSEDIDKMYDITQKDSTYPQTPDWTVKDANGDSMVLDNVQHEQLKEKQGTYSYEWTNEFFESQAFKNAIDGIKDEADEARVYANLQEELASIHSVAEAKAKNELFGTPISDNMQKKLDALEKDGVAKVLDEAINKKETKKTLEDNGIDSSSKKNQFIINDKQGSESVLKAIETSGFVLDDSGNKRYSPNAIMNSISRLNLSPADQGYYIANKSTNTLAKPAKAAADSGNYTDVYYYYAIKDKIDGSGKGKKDGNIGVKNGEIDALDGVLKSMGLSGRYDEIRKWYVKK